VYIIVEGNCVVATQGPVIKDKYDKYGNSRIRKEESNYFITGNVNRA